MVLISAVRDYINRMLQDISGMKLLILDSHTKFVCWSKNFDTPNTLRRKGMSSNATNNLVVGLHIKITTPIQAPANIYRKGMSSNATDNQVVRLLIKSTTPIQVPSKVPRICYHLHYCPHYYSGSDKSLNNESVSDIDRLRLVILYTLRYEKESPVQLMQLFNKLASRSAKYKPGLVQFVLKQARVEKRTGDLFGNRDLLNIARNMARGLKGVENVYTQHQPLLFQTMESISKGRLRDVDYPYVGNHFQQGRPQEVVIFIVGGTTYEESRFVALQNASNSGIRFILGGSVVLNSKSTFLKDLEEAQRIARSRTAVI
nr:vacuolar protein sorting-associated protein 45 homolog [Quercus suber]